MSPGFTRCLGIDWSGARGRRHRGVAVARAGAEGALALEAPPAAGPVWSRAGVLQLLEGCRGTATLAGIDCAFSLPWPEEGPFPPGLAQPGSAVELWADVEAACPHEEDLYAGPVWRGPEALLAPYMFLGRPPAGVAYDPARRRRVERALKPAPNSVFKIVGPNTVGPGSFAGMRLLHALKRRLGEDVGIWPFDPVRPDRLTLVEIYPSLYYRLAGARRTADPVRLAAILRAFGAEPPLPGPAPSQDKADALVAAAALHRLARQPGCFNVPDDPQVTREGWIFGVPADAG